MKKKWIPAILGLCASTLIAEAADPAANMALVATPSTSHISGDAKLGALNDGHEPRNSAYTDDGVYGNWPTKGTQWVQYDWSQPISTDAAEIYWWNDGRGIHLPSAARLLYWDGNAFVPVEASEEIGLQGDQSNRITFKEVTTDKIRLEIDSANDASTGILEWRILDAGTSPNFPPSVQAGIDRSVVSDGQTYLRGQIKTLKGESRVEWRQLSGPGRVSFGDAGALNTTATFSQTGDYVVQLTGYGAGAQTTDTLNVQVVEGPPPANLEPVDTMPYTISSDLWNDWAKRIIIGWLPHSIEMINDPDLPEGGINNFIEAANRLQGKEYGGHRGYSFANAWVYNTIESICVALMVDPLGDPEVIEAQNALRETLDEWIPLILAAQEPDGYLQTFFTLSDRERWSEAHREDHEGYVAGYFLEAAISHYMLTNGEDLRLYNAAKRLADCWYDNIGGEPGKQEWWDEHQGMEIALVRFGRFVNTVEEAGNGDKYIALSKFLLDCRSGGNEYSQSHVPVVEQYEAVGHAVRASYSYAAMADVAMETHDTDYQSAVISLFDNLINRKYYVTGAIGSGETSEGFGPDYSLPHTAYAESCSSCGLIFFEHKLNMAYHDAKFADLYEETLYNALLGSLDLDGKNFYYQNPLTSFGGRYPWHICPCCIGNIPRTLLMLPTWTYVKDADDLYVNMFLGSQVTVSDVGGTNVEMVQETDYPWYGNVAITVNPEQTAEFGIRIRVPNREVSELYYAEPNSDGILWMKVNGQKVDPVIENGYAIIDRTWKAGDKIEFELPMEIQVVRAVDKIAATRGEVALRYGPLIYTFESADQSLDKTFDPESAELRLEWMPKMLDGIMAIRGKWSDGSDLLAIPYYARSNRLDGGSSDRAGFGGPGAIGGGDADRAGFGGPGAVGGGDSGRDEGGPTSKVWVEEADALPRPTRTFWSEGNPILGDGSYYSADAAPLSHDGKLYIYFGNDEPPEYVGGFVLNHYGVFATSDPEMREWELYENNMVPGDVFEWATGERAYAGQALQGLDGRFYWYVPVEWENDTPPNSMVIGVAVSDSPVGPWEDPIGKPLVTWFDVFGDKKIGQEVIDPHTFIDDDGTPYLYWGSWGAAYVVKLDETMTAMDGEIKLMKGLDWFFEAPWIIQRNDLYYLIYDWKKGGSEYTPSNYQAAIAYATSTSLDGPWEVQDIILHGTSSTTVHPSVIEHDDRWWLTYHTKDAERGGHFRRSVAIDELHWDGDKMLPVEQTWANPLSMELTRNLALEAESSASYTEQPPMSLWALNDGQPPVVRLPPDQWGNYRSNESKVESDWIQYDWEVPVRITGVGIRFHQDPNWIRPPAAWKLEYKNVRNQWVEVKGATYPTEVDEWLAVDFEPVTTPALRATFKGEQNGDYFHSVTVSEWEVYSQPAIKMPSGRIETKVGQAPELPETVRLQFEGVGVLPVPIRWPQVDPELYAKPGSFTVEGKASGQAADYVTVEIVVTR